MRLVVRLNDKKKSKIILTHRSDIIIVMYKAGLLFLNDKLIINEQQFIYKKKSLAKKDHNMLKYLDAFLDKITRLSIINNYNGKYIDGKARLRDIMFSDTFTVNNPDNKQLFVSKSSKDTSYEVYLPLDDINIKPRKKILRKLARANKDLDIKSIDDLNKFKEFIKPILG